MRFGMMGAAAAAFLASAPVSAATYLVSYAPTTNSADWFTFNVDSNPTPTTVAAGSFVSLITNGRGAYTGRTSARFYATSNGGLFDNFYGDPVFSGSISMPTILTGTYVASMDPFTMAATGVVTIAAIGTAVPEPAIWALMILGMGAVGFAMRRRKNVNMAVRFA